jgi:hypothetical protein
MQTYLACICPVVHTMYEKQALIDSKSGEVIILSHTDTEGLNQYETAISMQSLPELQNKAWDFCSYCGTANGYDTDSLRQGHDCYYCGSN